MWLMGHTVADNYRRLKVDFESLDKNEFASATGSADDDEEVFDWFKDMRETVDKSALGHERHPHEHDQY